MVMPAVVDHEPQNKGMMFSAGPPHTSPET
jgi:hypothetical protein